MVLKTVFIIRRLIIFNLIQIEEIHITAGILDTYV